MSKYNDLSKTGENLVDYQCIRDSVINILMTSIGERPFRRGFGTNIEDYLFMPYSFSVTQLIRSELTALIPKWDPRVEVSSNTSIKMNPDSRSYSLELWIKIKDLDTDINILNTDFYPKENKK